MANVLVSEACTVAPQNRCTHCCPPAPPVCVRGGSVPPPSPHPGTDQAVRGGRHGQMLHSGFPPRQGDACGSADARSSTDACLS